MLFQYRLLIVTSRESKKFQVYGTKGRIVVFDKVKFGIGSKGISSMSRTSIILAVLTLAVCLGCGEKVDPSAPRVIILGFDGMDYGLTRQMMEEGRLPHFSRLAEAGYFGPLRTSVPPESPVAWANFITGMDAGGHGIFDFLHRDPTNMMPTFSTSQTAGAETSIELGKWKIPLSGGTVELLRGGKAFWEVLGENGIETTIIKIPANFPPSGTATREISGMGTPDLLGSYGTFSFYTTKFVEMENKDIGGADIYEVEVEKNTVAAAIKGPPNPFLVEPEDLKADFTVHIDPEADAVLLVVGDEERVLGVGEWSDWVPITFDLIPTQAVYGICRFYLKEVRPEFQLYVSPVNIDPNHAALPVSHPESYAAELAEETGLFYTQGMPEDTNVLDGGIFTLDEFLEQAHIAGEENIDQYKIVLDRFKDGLLFYYFSNSDLMSHMMWRPMDPGHPRYDEEIDGPYKDVIPKLYERFDEVVGYTEERLGDNTILIVMSDHGFASWRRAFHLNGWLQKEGYLEVIDPDLEDDQGLFMNVDWSRTRAYGLGFASLYINLKGREQWGIVPPEERRSLMEEISTKLRELIDPGTGEHAVANVYFAEDDYEYGEYLDIGPDMIVGCAKGYRVSDASVLGKIPIGLFEDNTRRWSGDHLMDPNAVPGILLTNRPLKKAAPRLQDLPGAILAEYGIEEFPPAKKMN